MKINFADPLVGMGILALFLCVSLGIFFLPNKLGNPCEPVMFQINMVVKNPSTLRMGACSSSKSGDTEIRKGNFYSKTDLGIEKSNSFSCEKPKDAKVYQCKF
ncbi:MAG: hypothetical protein ACK4NC_04285 [Candidatus Gracilibacteria bacterium]